MTWTKVGAEFFDSPGMLAVDRDARLLHVETLVWCNAQETDGFVPKHAMHKISDSPNPLDAIAQLIAAGEWESTAAGWHLLHFLKDQPSREKNEEGRADQARRTRRSRLHALNDHSLCLPGRKECQTMMRNAVTDGVTDDLRPTDSPSDRPTAREGGREDGVSRSAAPSARAPGSAARGEKMPKPSPNGDTELTIDDFYIVYSDGHLIVTINYEQLDSLQYQNAMYVLVIMGRELEDQFTRVHSVHHEGSEITFEVPPESAQSAWAQVAQLIRSKGIRE